MPFQRGRTYWAWARGRDSRKRVSLGTSDKNVAREIESMLKQLAAKREWQLLEAAVNGPSSVGELYDHWREGPAGLADLRAKLSDGDLNLYVPGWRRWVLGRASDETVERYVTQLRALIPEGDPFQRSQFIRKVISPALAALGKSGSTVKRYHAAWSSFARYLVEIEVIDTNPMRDVRTPSPNPPKTGIDASNSLLII